MSRQDIVRMICENETGPPLAEEVKTDFLEVDDGYDGHVSK